MIEAPKVELSVAAALRLHKVLEYWDSHYFTLGEHFYGLLDLSFLRGYTAGDMARVLQYHDHTNREMV